MSKLKTIGQCQEVRCQIEFQWTVENIFSYKVDEDKHFQSPPFAAQGSRWYLVMFPNGQTKANSAGWISIYLFISFEDGVSFTLERAKLSFGVKKADGAVEIKAENITTMCPVKDGFGNGRSKFLSRSELLERRSILAPSDKLTVTCNLVVDYNSAMRDKLSQNLTSLFTSKKCCDATLKVQHQQFPVHKCILASRSPVFDAMFEANMKEKNTGTVEIVDCDPGAFRDFLLYIYSGKFEIHSNKIFELYTIADKYDVEELKSACIGYMRGELSVENVCETAVFADLFDQVELQQEAQVCFNDNFGEIINTPNWESFLKANSRLANKLLKNMASGGYKLGK